MFHVRPTGDLGKCTAAPGRCPFRNEGAQHFNTFKEATAHAEKIFEAEDGLPKFSHLKAGGDVRLLSAGAGLVLFEGSNWDDEPHMITVEDLPNVARVDAQVRKCLASSWEKAVGQSDVFSGRELRGRIPEAKGDAPYFQLLDRRLELGNTTLFAVALVPTQNKYGSSPKNWETIATSAKYFSNGLDASRAFENLHSLCGQASIDFWTSS